MNAPIYPCLWFDGNAREAADKYCSLFENSKIIDDNGLVVIFEIEGKKVMGLNGGPMFKINPSISLYVSCDSDSEIEKLWTGLSEGGFAMLPLDAYPWSPRYGWLVDKYGMTWQLTLGDLPVGRHKIIPSFLFVGHRFGDAQKAISLYTGLFPGSKVEHLDIPGPEEPSMAGTLRFGQFTLGNEVFAAMDGPGEHEFTFNEGVSLVVECRDQDEIDTYWNTLITNGGEESQCGWLKDRFGVSWQIVPSQLSAWLADPVKGQQVMQKLLKMRKLVICELITD